MPVDMSEGLPPLDNAPLLEHIAALDQARIAFFDACTDYTQRPFESKGTIVDNRADAVTKTLEQTLGFVFSSDAPDEDKTFIAARLLEEDDKSRVDHLNTIIKGDHFKSGRISAKNHATMMLTALDQADYYELISLAMSNYKDALTIDIDTFFDYAATATNKGMLITMGHIGLEHSVDIAKTAAAVALGIIVARRFKK